MRKIIGHVWIFLCMPTRTLKTKVFTCEVFEKKD